MKSRITFSIALAASVVFVTLIFASQAGAQNQLRPVVDTGVVPLGPDQVLRLTITGFGEDLLRVQFRQMTYSQDVCNGGVCKSSIVSNQISGPMTLMSGEAASIDIPASFMGGVYVGVRGVVMSNRRDVRVQGIVFDTSTQRVVTLLPTGTVTF